MSLLDREEESRQSQPKGIIAGYPILTNLPYDAAPIDTDQSRNVDVHHDPPQQTDGGFLRQEGMEPNPTKPALA